MRGTEWGNCKWGPAAAALLLPCLVVRPNGATRGMDSPPRHSLGYKAKVVLCGRKLDDAHTKVAVRDPGMVAQVECSRGCCYGEHLQQGRNEITQVENQLKPHK